MSETPKNQTDAVRIYMQNTGPIDFLIAANLLGISQLTARFSELRRQGYTWDKCTTSGKNRYGNTFTKTVYSNLRREQGELF